MSRTAASWISVRIKHLCQRFQPHLSHSSRPTLILLLFLAAVMTGCSGWTLVPVLIDSDTGETSSFFGEGPAIPEPERAHLLVEDRILHAISNLENGTFRERALAADSLISIEAPALPYLEWAISAAPEGSYRRNSLVAVMRGVHMRLPDEVLTAEIRRVSLPRSLSALRALSKRGPRVVPILLAHLDDGRSPIRCEVVSSMRRMTGLYPCKRDESIQEARARWQSWYAMQSRPAPSHRTVAAADRRLEILSALTW